MYGSLSFHFVPSLPKFCCCQKSEPKINQRGSSSPHPLKRTLAYIVEVPGENSARQTLLGRQRPESGHLQPGCHSVRTPSLEAMAMLALGQQWAETSFSPGGGGGEELSQVTEVTARQLLSGRAGLLLLLSRLFRLGASIL